MNKSHLRLDTVKDGEHKGNKRARPVKNLFERRLCAASKGKGGESRYHKITLKLRMIEGNYLFYELYTTLREVYTRNYMHNFYYHKKCHM